LSVSLTVYIFSFSFEGLCECWLAVFNISINCCQKRKILFEA